MTLASLAQDWIYAAAMTYLVQNKLPLGVYATIERSHVVSAHLACAFCGGLLWGGVLGVVSALDLAPLCLTALEQARLIAGTALGGAVAALMVEKLAKLSTAMQEMAKQGER